MLASGFFHRYPNLRVASIELGSEWVFHLHKKLKKSVEDVPKDATLGQVQANIQANKESVRAAYNRLAQSIACS